MLSRRGFLVGGVTTVGVAAGALISVEQGWLPGRIAVARALGQCDLDAPMPDLPPGTLQTNSFRSTYRNRPVSWILALPPEQASPGLPVALVLHGRGGEASSAFDTLGLHGYLAEYVAAGGPPFALVAIDGGDGYWHPRADGDDPLGMVVRELLPRLLSEYGLRIDEIAATGWSMGGYGALLLARESGRDRLGGSRLVAAAALSPALFASYAESAGGAFDDSADFASWGDLIADPGVGSDVALMVACGGTDAFTDATREYRSAVEAAPVGGVTRGCHDVAYWRSQGSDLIAFLGANLPT